MQLSLLDEVPELNKVFFIDIFAESFFDINKRRMRLTTILGQPVPRDIKISCPSKLIGTYPEGTIFKLDARLVRKGAGKRPYFVAINRSHLQRAIEFFDYNLKVQNGFDYVYPKRKQTARAMQARV
ncbi:hypothetical protein [Emticicia sp. 21SJ11W-3]|uniref:hypothetical protein n=1 Tax=Emticicia sp. 21SJ11W-3 TaxID=2916755 RepID=UPI0020A10AB7|nr:hypothetical protein [Emticicia sp. 21SJ11W-3]UTA70212.1 hypothetical protein MB380_10395 [Emticicia sp. 21SJ11W-3]